MEKRFEVELPEEVLACFGWQKADVPRRVREALVMDLLRRDHLSEAQAAALLNLNRWELLDLMGRYQVPAIRLSQGNHGGQIVIALDGRRADAA